MAPTLRLLAAELARRCDQDGPHADGTGTGGVAEMERAALLPPGKLLRPLLFTESAAATGMRRADTLAAALGVERLHVGSLVHDDVIDGDTQRRGRPSVVARYGLPNAIVTGDALLIGAFREVAAHTPASVPDARRLAVVQTLAEAGVDLCRGQAMEDELRAQGDRDVDRYLRMISLKTGALFRASCLGGAQLAGAPAAAQHALTRYAEHLGRAFQMADDLLPHTSDTATSGKSALSDLRNARPTFPVLLCWHRTNEQGRAQLSALLAGTLPAETAMETLRVLLRESGALTQARAAARAEAAQAKAALDELPATEARAALHAVADLAVDRDR
ncbi:polyprenyl synthetase family protein [Streptomyces albus subsp. chlorinus]|nr:polyprenyl synthetase family protein [Streptomyces albus]NSC20079.1 polyprenyl synthetase family protein [Streptomyces albus subsp. chlorinus]